ncbi:aerotolerance operon BatA [Planctomycetales bacterium 10988]|nr:aerotolerance operon BatA [Planctomycetales bacterium 10988]
MFVFDYLWTLIFLPLPWLLRLLLPPRQVNQVAVRVPFGDRLEKALAHASNVGSLVKDSRSLVVPTILWVLVMTAVARPQWIEPPLTKELPTRDLLLLVDLSSSMEQEDFTNQEGAKVDRLSAVKEVVGDFLIHREGDRVGLVVFGDAPFLQAPFSTDLELSRQLLDECQVGMAGPRTAFGDGIGLGVNLFDESDAPAKTIIALTDGNDTKSQVPPIEAARVAAERGITIYTVAIGDPTTVGEDKLDAQALKDVATAAKGKYYFAADRKSLVQIYDELDRIETREVKTISHRPRRELYYYPLLFAVLISMGTKFLALLSREKSAASLRSDHRIHVNPATGKLEVES